MNKETKVGALVVAFLVFILFFIVWIKGNPFRQTKLLNVLFDNVHGLSIGSPVEYAGYECGKVKNFRVTPGGIVTEILIIDPKVRIHEGDKFIIIPSSTIASEYQIFIVPYSKSSPEVPNQSTIIGQSSPGMQDFLFQAEEALSNLRVVMSQVQKILLELDSSVLAVGPLFQKAGEIAENGTIDNIANNLNQSAKSIKNVSQATDELIRGNSTKIEITLNNLVEITNQLNERLTAIDPQKLKETVDSLQKTSKNLEKLSGMLPTDELKRNIKTFTDAADQVKGIMQKVQSPNPEEDVPTLVKRNLQRIDRILTGLEASLKSKSLLKVLMNRVPISGATNSKSKSPKDKKEMIEPLTPSSTEQQPQTQEIE